MDIYPVLSNIIRYWNNCLGLARRVETTYYWWLDIYWTWHIVEWDIRKSGRISTRRRNPMQIPLCKKIRIQHDPNGFRTGWQAKKDLKNQRRVTRNRRLIKHLELVALPTTITTSLLIEWRKFTMRLVRKMMSPTHTWWVESLTYHRLSVLQ